MTPPAPAREEPMPLWAAARRDAARRAGRQPAPVAQDAPASPQRSGLSAQRSAPGRRLRQLAGAAGILMAGFVASRVLGLVRNGVLAAYYGASPDYEAYVAAIQVPDTVFQVLAGGVMGAAFIPIFSRYLTQGDDEEAWRLASSAINLAFLLTGTCAVALAIFAGPLTHVLVPGRDAAFQELVAQLVRIMLISPVLFAVSGFFSSILNTYQRFFYPALAPLMYNLGIIGGALLLHDRYGIHGVAIGVAFGAAGHLLVQVPNLLQIGARWWPVIDWRQAGVREVGRLMVPRMFGLGVAQLNKLANTALASFLVVGSIGYLDYAWLVFMVPLGVFGMAVSTAVFPTLAQQTAADQHDEMAGLFSLSLRMILLLTIPAAVGLIIVGGPIVRLLFERHQFTPAVTQATALALACYALGLPGHSLVEIVNRAFYALHDTFTPVKAAALAVLVNLAISGLVVVLALAGHLPGERAYAGLALANAVAATCEGLLLVGWLRHRLPALALRPLALAVGRFVAAAALMGSLLAVADDSLLRLVNTSTVGSQLLGVGALIALGAAAYLGLTMALGSREPRLLLGLLRRR